MSLKLLCTPETHEKGWVVFLFCQEEFAQGSEYSCSACDIVSVPLPSVVQVPAVLETLRPVFKGTYFGIELMSGL